MGKKLIAGSLLFFFFVSTSGIFAVETPIKDEKQEYHWNDKLQRGALNIVTFPVEFVRQFHLVASQDTSSAKRLFAFIPAFGGAILRLGAGLVEVITFPFDFPTEGKKPLIQPEFVWDATE